ncbi:MAG: HTTM domain-containing protein [SAR324 cluster bacterium]|nr:HTTM domain-containing protein [SAR324 cluster bacterium]
MNARVGIVQQALGAWLDFWFAESSPVTLALMRIGTGILLLYNLLIRSYDLEALYATGSLGSSVALRGLDPMAFPFSLFAWSDSAVWLWAVHLAAIAVAVAFLLGVYPTATGLLALVFHLSYGLRNPAIMLGLDGLLALALFYLALAPCGRALTVLPAAPAPAPRSISRREAAQRPPRWGGLPLRALQIHLCVLYFTSGLGRLNAAWLSGVVLWHPRLVEKGVPFAAETLQDHPFLLTLVADWLVLFELFYGVLIWLPRLRYPVMGVAAATHLAVGILWGKLPFNLLMLVMNLAFIRPGHLEFLAEQVGRLLNLSAGAAESRR